MTPLVSIVITAFRSESTIGRCLRHLRRQTFRDFETIVVDSSQGSETTKIVLGRYPEVRFVRSGRRLLPGAARAVGIRLARGSLIVSLDPDCYPEARWLERLVAAHRESGLPIAGAIRCHGNRWFDHGIHFQKFGSWVPGGPDREVLVAAGASALYPRYALDVDAIDGQSPVYDTRISYELAARGLPTRFAPAAVVAHDHEMTLAEFLHERFVRARYFVRFRINWESWSSGRIVLWIVLLFTLVRPIRFQAGRAAQMFRSGLLSQYLASLPVTVSGDVANHVGEAVAHLEILRERAFGRSQPSAS